MQKIYQDEEFKKIENSNYWISNYGRVFRDSYQKWCKVNNSFSTTKPLFKKLSNNNSKKYWRVKIVYIDGTEKTEAVHRLVGLYFIENKDNKPYINHIDGNKDNNFYKNLEWCTNQENMTHRYETLQSFTNLHGSKGSKAKLTESQVVDIAQRIKNKEDYKSIIKVYPFIKKTTLSELKAGRSWRHLNLFTPTKIKREKYFDLRYGPTINEN